MKQTMVLSLLLAFVLPLGVARAEGQAKDEKAIRKVFSGFADAWAQDDLKAMASLWSEDGDSLDLRGRIFTGRAQVEQSLANGHAMRFKNSHINFSTGTIRFIKPDVAVFTTDFKIPDAHTRAGGLMSTGGVLTSVMVKKGGKWMIFASRPMIPPLPPRP